MLSTLKAEVLAAALEAQSEGLCRRKSGNFSRIDDTRQFIAITPTGANRQTMMPNDIIIIDKNLRIVENISKLQPSSEAPMHVAVYAARPDAVAVAHTHSPYALAFAAAEKPVPPILVESSHLNNKDGYIPIAPYGRRGTPELAESVRQPLADADAIILAHHGVLAVSSDSVSDAVLKAGYVEDICAAYLRSLLLMQSEPRLLPLSDVARRAPQFV